MSRLFNFGKRLTSSGILLSSGFAQRSKTVAAYSRSMWYMCSRSDTNILKVKSLTECCQCGCNGLIHTQGEKSLVDFLKAEIVEEKKAQKMSSLPKDLDGFLIEAEGAELTFKKESRFETISLSMNVSHSVDSEENPDESFMEEMKSKPDFEIDIIRGKTTLSFSCSFTEMTGSEEKADTYQIDEVALYEGEWNEKNYAIAGDILDGNLYDLFMSLLFEKGITNEFIEKVGDIATYYEHSKYINLLENLKNFSSTN